MASARLRSNLSALCLAALLAGAVVFALLSGGSARAADAEALEGKLASAQSEAGALAAELRTSRERLAGAEAEAAAAEAREARLSGLLAEGEERAARLSAELASTRRRLRAEKARLRRSKAALAARLVAIYEQGDPSTLDLVLRAESYDQLVAQANYLRQIAESDRALAARVAQVRRAVAAEARGVARLRRRAVAYDARLAAARDEIASVRAAAQEAAAELAAVSADRQAQLSRLKDRIGQWETEIRKAQEASEAEAAAEVGRWLGGPYSIPSYIVMCESGGDYSAVNPSSGAGGAYQILPSTWELYGGQGEPQNAPKAEQDRIAAEIWADSGSSAWVCG
ncbi:MAG: transglycosylase family protein [Solirubrobacterales bacterium]